MVWLTWYYALIWYWLILMLHLFIWYLILYSIQMCKANTNNIYVYIFLDISLTSSLTFYMLILLLGITTLLQKPRPASMHISANLLNSIYRKSSGWWRAWCELFDSTSYNRPNSSQQHTGWIVCLAAGVFMHRSWVLPVSLATSPCLNLPWQLWLS